MKTMIQQCMEGIPTSLTFHSTNKNYVMFTAGITARIYVKVNKLLRRFVSFYKF